MNKRLKAKPWTDVTLAAGCQCGTEDEPLVRIADVEVVSVRREPLEAITAEDVALEGFPGMSREAFMGKFFQVAQGIQPGDLVTRIEWRYLP